MSTPNFKRHTISSAKTKQHTYRISKVCQISNKQQPIVICDILYHMSLSMSCSSSNILYSYSFILHMSCLCRSQNILTVSSEIWHVLILMLRYYLATNEFCSLPVCFLLPGGTYRQFHLRKLQSAHMYNLLAVLQLLKCC